MDFKDKVYIVTGASSGMGKSCCELLLEKEAVVAGIDINDICHGFGSCSV